MRDRPAILRRLEADALEAAKRQEWRRVEEARKEEEAREAKRQQQRLNFLLTQTELYSHFMAAKVSGQPAAPAAEADGDVDAGAEGDPEMAQLAQKARAKARAAAEEAHAKTAAFDAQRPQAAGGEGTGGGEEVTCPTLFRGSLKGYQLKGLQWLVNVYEQGLNCILADEMVRARSLDPSFDSRFLRGF